MSSLNERVINGKKYKFTRGDLILLEGDESKIFQSLFTFGQAIEKKHFRIALSKGEKSAWDEINRGVDTLNALRKKHEERLENERIEQEKIDREEQEKLKQQKLEAEKAKQKRIEWKNEQKKQHEIRVLELKKDFHIAFDEAKDSLNKLSIMMKLYREYANYTQQARPYELFDYGEYDIDKEYLKQFVKDCLYYGISFGD